VITLSVNNCANKVGIMKLLIAEDEPKVGMYLRQGLTEAGYIVDLVTSGTDALHQLWTGRSQDRSATLS